MSSRKTLVTGTGMLTSAGIGSEKVFEALLKRERVRGERSYAMGAKTLTFPVYPVGQVELSEWVDPKHQGWIEQAELQNDIDFGYLAAVAKLALADAGFSGEQVQSLSLVVGHENLGVVRLLDRMLQPQEGGGAHPSISGQPMEAFQAYQQSFYNVQTFPHLFYLSKLLGIGGMTYCVNNACACGLYALELGRMLIETGKSDAVLVLCGDYAHATEYMWLREKGFQSPTGLLQPFAPERDGSVLGDGAAAFVLESALHAAKRKARPVCSYEGGQFRQETWRMTLPDVAARTYSDVIMKAAQLAGGPVDLLVPHGAGSQLWDRYEAGEIRRAFAALEQPVPPVAAWKGYFGHTLGASSLLEAAVLAMCVERDLIVPTADLVPHDDRIGLPIAGQVVEARLQAAMKTVPAYGGFFAASVFKKVE